jgi:hypothetical protein
VLLNVFRKLRSYLTGRQPSSNWTVVENPNGPRVLFDQEMVEYLTSRAPEPTQQSLDTMIDRAHLVRVIEGGVSHGQPLGKKILLEDAGEETLSGLRQLLRIVEGAGGHCMCHGSPAMEFLDRAGRRLAVIGLHHGHLIRWSAWKHDAKLVDGYRLLEWLAVHGVHYPLQEYKDSQQRRAINEAAWQRWFAAMPSCLQPLWQISEAISGC